MQDAGTITQETKTINRLPADSVEEHPPLQKQSLYYGLFSHMTEGFACFQEVVDTAGYPVDFVTVDMNRAFRRLARLSAKTVHSKRTSELFSNVKTEVYDWINTCGEVAQTGKGLTFEGHCANLDKWFSVNSYCPQKGYFAMIIKDITARKKTEQALRQSERQHKKLASSITDPFFAVDSCLKIVYWNDASEKFVGIGAGEVMGKHFFEVFDRDKGTKKAVRAYLAVMRTKKPRMIVDRLPRGDSNRLFEMQIYPTGNGISVLAKDITERKKLQGSLEQYAKRLEDLVRIRTEKLREVERLAAIGETAGMIGHDIRNPLQSIIGELYLTKEDLNELPDCKIKKDLAASLRSIEEQTFYINKIVSDLQDYAKTSTPLIEEVNLEDILKNTILTLPVPDKISVYWCVEKPCPILRTDPSFIKRILTNLIINGIQAIPEKGGELRVNAFPRDETLIMSVSDTGVGIPDCVKDKLFKPLFTTKSKGQGFGLAVVKKLVEGLDGMISFETKVGKGTTFIIELPLKVEPTRLS